MKVDMSPQAVTNRMKMLDQLWELAVALRGSKIVVDTNPKRKKMKSSHEITRELSDKISLPNGRR